MNRPKLMPWQIFQLRCWGVRLVPKIECLGPLYKRVLTVAACCCRPFIEPPRRHLSEPFLVTSPSVPMRAINQPAWLNGMSAPVPKVDQFGVGGNSHISQAEPRYCNRTLLLDSRWIVRVASTSPAGTAGRSSHRRTYTAGCPSTRSS